MTRKPRDPAREHQKFERPCDTRIAIVLAAALLLSAGCRRPLRSEDAGNGQIGFDAAADAIADIGGHGNDSGNGSDGAGGLDGVGGTDAATADASADAGWFACGKVLCVADEICVTPHLCGGPLRCDELPDGGECPPGTMLHPDCPGGQPGCRPICPPPSTFCAPRPAGCGAMVDCACVRPICEPLGAGCVSASGRNISCANI